MVKTVNLEAGMPTAQLAINRLTYALNNSPEARVLKLIHGYGSSGTGGRIRVEVRQYLARLKAQKKIKLYVIGEEFSIFNPDARTLLQTCDPLRKDRDLDRHNNGVTFVLLR